MTYRSTPSGFTMVELLTVVAIIGIAVALAVPLFEGAIARVRVRSALDRLVGEIYRARMAAVEEGGSVQLFLVADGDGCTRALRLQRPTNGGPPLATSSLLDLPGLCLRHSGDSIVAFNGRGMLRPPTRSFFINHGPGADSVVISIAGRVRRSYRRKRSREKLSAIGNNFRRLFTAVSRKSLLINGIDIGTDISHEVIAVSPYLRGWSAGWSNCGSISPARVMRLRALVGIRGDRRRRTGRLRQPRSVSMGFSLIEILVAMVILSFGIMGLQAVAMNAVRSVAMADRQTRYASHASDSLEAALYRLRTGQSATQVCVNLPPFGDRLSRRIALAGSLATVSVVVIPSRSYRPSPRLPLELSSSIFVPEAIRTPVSGSACS